MRQRPVLFAHILFAATVLSGCKDKQSTTPSSPAPVTQPNNTSGYFKTPFQNECQYIVQTIALDLAQELDYAASGSNRRIGEFTVAAVEKRATDVENPEYQLLLRRTGKPDLKCDLVVDGPIWSPAIYLPLAKAIASWLGSPINRSTQPEDTSFLAKMVEVKAENIELENQRLSAALEKNFVSPELHEQAALLYGAFMLRDYSGTYFDIRSPLCRTAAHLTLARLFRGPPPGGVNGRLAEAILFAMESAQTPALQILKELGTNNPAAAPVVRSLQTWISGDYRPLRDAKNCTPMEKLARFDAISALVESETAWQQLDEDQRQTIDYVRSESQSFTSVGVGHELHEVRLRLEMAELMQIYDLTHTNAGKVTHDEIVKSLNQEPDGCFRADADGLSHVQVIGWGQWASFLQRHLCRSIVASFRFLDESWGVHDEAKEFADYCENQFASLKLYPFVRRSLAREVASYHEAVDDAFKVTVASPHLVPAEVWNDICRKPRFTELYQPVPNPHINEWFNHNPPPGTAYDFSARRHHSTVNDRGDSISRLEKLHQICPYDLSISRLLLTKKYSGHATFEQSFPCYSNLVNYSYAALSDLAATVRDKPDEYEKWMSRAAELSPKAYYVLADYQISKKRDDEAAKTLEKAEQVDTDPVRVSNYSYWRVGYYIDKGKWDAARKLADFGGETYSHRGLSAKAMFLEATTNYDGAVEWYRKIEERYNDARPLVYFCIRYKLATSDNKFDDDLKKHLNVLFPDGLQHVGANDFQGKPRGGVKIENETDLVKAAGLKMGDIIVAVYGVKVENMDQYIYMRDSKTVPEIELLVWQGNGYNSITSSPPQHRFRANFVTYPSE